MNIQCVFTRNMAKLTCDSLLDLTSNANIVTGSPVPYNRFMKYICQKQFWKQILALWGKKNEYSIFQIHVKILWKEIKFIHIIDLRSGCKKRNDCKNQPYHHVFMKNTIINHLWNRISQRIRRVVFFDTFILMNAFNMFKSLKTLNIFKLQFVKLYHYEPPTK